MFILASTEHAHAQFNMGDSYVELMREDDNHYQWYSVSSDYHQPLPEIVTGSRVWITAGDVKTSVSDDDPEACDEVQLVYRTYPTKGLPSGIWKASSLPRLVIEPNDFWKTKWGWHLTPSKNLGPFYPGTTVEFFFQGHGDNLIGYSGVRAVTRFDDRNGDNWKFSIEAPEPPELLTPGSTSGPGPDLPTLTPTFSWMASLGATNYGLYISEAPYGSEHLVYVNENVPNQTSLSLPAGYLEPMKQYRWNMRAENKSGWTDFSSRRYFTTQSTGEYLAAPELGGPANRATNVSITPSFSWSTVSGANQYWLMVATSSSSFPVDPNATSCPDCVATGVSGLTDSTSHTLPNSFPVSGTSRELEPDTKYYWMVQAWNTDGTQGLFSEVRSFTTAETPTPLSTPQISSIEPAIVPGINQRQWITLLGENFTQNSVVILRTGNDDYPIPANRTKWVNNQTIRIYANVSCSEAQWTAQVVNPDGEISQLYEFIVGITDVTPVEAVDFGVVTPGQTVERIFSVRNQGVSAVPLSVSVAPPFSVANDPYSPISPDGQQQVIIRYQPSQSTRDEKTVIFSLGAQSIMRSVSGRAVSPTVNTGSISGEVNIVVLSTTKRVPKAHVDIKKLNEDGSLAIGRVGLTDSNGHFTFAGIPAGNYTVSASPSPEYDNSHLQADSTVVITEGTTSTLVLTLPLSARPLVAHKDIPVVLVRGRGEFGDDENGYWKPLRDYLRNVEGFKYVWDPNESGSLNPFHINGEAGIHANADTMKLFIANQMTTSEMVAYEIVHGFKPQEINIVAHSMGGLITRQYLHKYSEAIYDSRKLPRVRDVIMLGTPHAGSVLATLRNIHFDFWTELWQSNKDLTPDNMIPYSDSTPWPSGKGTRLFTVGGNTPNLSNKYIQGYSLIFWFNKPGDTISDGAVPLLSSRGEYRKAEYPGSSLLACVSCASPVYNTVPCFTLPDNSIGHQEVSLNHGELVESSNIHHWIGNILGGGIPADIGEVESAAKFSNRPTNTEPPVICDMPSWIAPNWTNQLVVYSVASATQSVNFACMVETTVRAKFVVSCSSTSTPISLISPSTQTIDLATCTNSASLYHEVISSEDGVMHSVDIHTPEAGEWRIAIGDAGSSGAINYSVWGWVDSPVQLVVSQPEQIILAQDVHLLAAISLGNTNVMPISIDAELTAPSGATNNVVLMDDGNHGDGVCGDGVFGALVSGINEQGICKMVYKSEGLHPIDGTSYQRVLIRNLTVSEPGGFVVEVKTIEPIDADEDGLTDAVRLDLLVNLSDPGDYAISGSLAVQDQDMDIKATTDFTLDTNGNAIVSLLFDARSLPQNTLYGPFQTGEVKLFKRGAQLLWMDTLPGGAPVDVLMFNEISRHLIIKGNLEFGQVRVGTQAVAHVTLRNEGWERMTIGSLNLPEGFVGTYSGDIEPGEEVVIPITFTPTAVKSYSGDLTIISDATAGDTAAPLSGTGLPEAIPFADWLNLYGGTGSLTNVLNPDGIPNFMAYLHNIDPTNGISSSDTNALPYWYFSGTGMERYVAVEYRLNRHATGFSYILESTPRLIPEPLWQTMIPNEFHTLSEDFSTGDTRYRMIMETGILTNRFMRLRAVFTDY